jgi:hypothetical protein
MLSTLRQPLSAAPATCRQYHMICRVSASELRASAIAPVITKRHMQDCDSFSKFLVGNMARINDDAIARLWAVPPSPLSPAKRGFFYVGPVRGLLRLTRVNPRTLCQATTQWTRGRKPSDRRFCAARLCKLSQQRCSFSFARQTAGCLRSAWIPFHEVEHARALSIVPLSQAQ